MVSLSAALAAVEDPEESDLDRFWTGYLTDLYVALTIATRDFDGVARHLLRGRLPRLGDEGAPPWSFRGWMLPHVMDLLPAESGVGRGRWRYWLRTMEAGRILDEPIPQVNFYSVGEGSRAGCKMLEKCCEIIGRRQGYSGSPGVLIEWLGWALAVEKEPPRLDAETAEELYRTFCLDPILAEPADYLGWLMSEHKGRGKDPTAFFPTPLSVVQLMAMMVFPEGERHARATVNDPCVGTGRMLMVASNWSLRLSGQDINPRCVAATKINGALFAPWLAFPFPESFFAEAPLDPPLGVMVTNQAGQGLLFPCIDETLLVEDVKPTAKEMAG